MLFSNWAAGHKMYQRRAQNLPLTLCDTRRNNFCLWGPAALNRLPSSRKEIACLFGLSLSGRPARHPLWCACKRNYSVQTRSGANEIRGDVEHARWDVADAEAHLRSTLQAKLVMTGCLRRLCWQSRIKAKRDEREGIYILFTEQPHTGWLIIFLSNYLISASD